MHFDTFVSMLLANGHFVLAANLETHREFIQDGDQVCNTTHLNPNFLADIEEAVGLPVDQPTLACFP
jgi:hypothetical protein